MLHVITWVWGTKYSGHYLHRLEAGVARHLTEQHRFLICPPQEEDEDLTKIPGCFARLRTFSPIWQRKARIKEGDTIVCLDLDLIVTGSLDGLFNRPEQFGILQGVNSTNPCPYNGSVWFLKAGYRPDVWWDFSLDAASKVPWFAFPDDQSWFHAKMPDAGALGPTQGVYAFGKPGWPKGSALPPNARIVAFPGHRDPAQFQHLDWVKANWK